MSNEQLLFNIQEIFGELGSATGGTKLWVGIHEDVKLSEVELGENYIDFIFEKDGKVANKRIWDPDINMVYPKTDKFGNEETPEQALVRDGKERLQHVIKIMRIFLGDDVVKTFQPATYRDTVKRAASMLNAAKDHSTVNIMLIYDSEGRFPTFGRFPNYVEKHIPGVPSTLRPSKWEEENRMTPANDVGEHKSDSVVY